MLSSEQDTYITCPSPKVQGLYEKGGKKGWDVDDYNECFLVTKEKLYTRTQQFWEHVQDLGKLKPTKSQHRGFEEVVMKSHLTLRSLAIGNW